jgi:hypothetical protein
MALIDRIINARLAVVKPENRSSSNEQTAAGLVRSLMRHFMFCALFHGHNNGSEASGLETPSAHGSFVGHRDPPHDE